MNQLFGVLLEVADNVIVFVRFEIGVVFISSQRFQKYTWLFIKYAPTLINSSHLKDRLAKVAAAFKQP